MVIGRKSGLMFDPVFANFETITTVVFVIVAGMAVTVLVRVAGRWKKDNDSPVVTVAATVVAKRADVNHHHPDISHHHPDAGVSGLGHYSSSTDYHATFGIEGGTRTELRVPGAEYALLTQGDKGQLTFQGSRYLGFTRG